MNIAGFLARSAARNPLGIALCTDDAPHASYGELHATAGRIGTWLRSRWGLQTGDRVALIGRNCTAYVETMFGAWYAGMSVVPVNFRLHPSEAAFILEDSGAALCVGDCTSLDGLASRAPTSADGAPVRLLPWEELIDSARTEVPGTIHPAGADEVAWLFYTSGTTGRPKGVMLTHENLRQMVLNFFADLMRPRTQSTLVHLAPLSHGSGMYLLAFIAAGAGNVVPTATSLREGEIVPLLNRQRRVAMFLAPTMVRRLIDLADIGSLRPGCIELIVYGGEPMTTPCIELAVERVGPHFAQIYGQGESPMTITRLQRDEIERSAGGRDLQVLASAGQSFTGVETRVVDERGCDVPTGEVGEVVIRGPTVMRGYWRREEDTTAQIRDGWLWTGDLGALDGRGYLTLHGRSRDLIISGGMNIYPREVEDALARHPHVAETAVVGGPDPDWGERVIAFVVARAGHEVSVGELDSLSRSSIARFKRPREYRFVAQLPRNAYGKVLKRELRRMLTGENDSDTRSVPHQ